MRHGPERRDEPLQRLADEGEGLVLASRDAADRAQAEKINLVVAMEAEEKCMLGALQKLAVRDKPCDAKEIVSLVGTAHNSVDTSIQERDQKLEVIYQ